MLSIYTKTYNKWYLCQHQKQNWKKGMKKGGFRVLVRMIKFDHCVGKYKDVDPCDSMKWGRESIYAICDASRIVRVVQELLAEMVEEELVSK